MPATGFAIGDVVLNELLADRGLTPKYLAAPDIFVIIGGAKERAEALGDIFLLREAGYRVEYLLRDSGFGKQFKTAGSSGARMALIYGEEELERREVKARDLRDGREESVPRQALLPRLAEWFGN